MQALDEAVKLARESDDRVRLAKALSSLGAVNTFSRDAADAEKTLREAVRVARGAEDREVRAAALNNLGNLLAAQEKFSGAESAYREAIGAADPGPLETNARANLASLAVAQGDFAEVPALNRAAIESAKALPDSHEKAFALLRAGRTWEALFEKAPAHEQGRRADALRAYERAAQVAEAAGATARCRSPMATRGTFTNRKRNSVRRCVSRPARYSSRRKIQSPDVLYQWEWQVGRILRAQGRRDDAIAAFQRSVDLLEEHPHGPLDAPRQQQCALVVSRSCGRRVLRSRGPFAPARRRPARRRRITNCLLQARDTCEQLKSVELEDYFQDDCVNLLKKKRETIEDVLQARGSAKERTPNDEALEKATRATAVVYLIPLRDRTETLLSPAQRTAPRQSARHCGPAHRDRSRLSRAPRETHDQRIPRGVLAALRLADPPARTNSRTKQKSTRWSSFPMARCARPRACTNKTCRSGST